MSLRQQIQLRKLVRHLLVVLLISVWAGLSSLVLDVFIEPAIKEYKLFTFQMGPNFFDWLMTWPIFLIIILSTVFPIWRFAYWLNAITYQEVREIDLKRLITWINWIQGIIIFSASISIIFTILYPPQWQKIEPREFSDILAFIYILPNFIFLRLIKIWVRKMTELQHQSFNRSDLLMPIIKMATPYFRLLQILSVIEAIVYIIDIHRNSAPAFILGIISVCLSIYILELGLRFAHFTAQDGLFSPSKVSHQQLKATKHY